MSLMLSPSESLVWPKGCPGHTGTLVSHGGTALHPPPFTDGNMQQPGNQRIWARKSATLIYLLTQICKSRKRSCKSQRSCRILPFLPPSLGEKSNRSKAQVLGPGQRFPLSIVPLSPVHSMSWLSPPCALLLCSCVPNTLPGIWVQLSGQSRRISSIPVCAGTGSLQGPTGPWGRWPPHPPVSQHSRFWTVRADGCSCQQLCSCPCPIPGSL